MPQTIQYHFSQHFLVPAKEALLWCTTFDSSDHNLMGNPKAQRYMIALTINTIILKDVFPSPQGNMEKQKLVQLYPDKLAWTSTHLTGPNQHSQFLYQISSTGKDRSILEFTANHIEYKESADIKLLANRLCQEDAESWKLLAKAMSADLKK